MPTFVPDNKIGTGDTVVGQRRRYSFLAWDDEWIQIALQGMIYDYSQVQTWVQMGTATPDDAASYFAMVVATFGVDMATTGVIVPFAGGILPDGWLVCDGSSLLIADYLPLWQAIGNVWGSVDSTHFNIPDLRGRTLVGQGLAGSGTTFDLAAYGGEETHTLDLSEVPSHSHTDAGHTHTEGTAAPTIGAAITGVPVPAAIPSVGVTGLGNANLDSSGSGGAHNNMQPFAVVNYAIIT
jgi:microcystin-dependent protein